MASRLPPSSSLPWPAASSFAPFEALFFVIISLLISVHVSSAPSSTLEEEALRRLGGDGDMLGSQPEGSREGE